MDSDVCTGGAAAGTGTAAGPDAPPRAGKAAASSKSQRLLNVCKAAASACAAVNTLSSHSKATSLVAQGFQLQQQLEAVRQRHPTTRSSLPARSRSGLAKLLCDGDDSTFIDQLGINKAAFEKFYAEFEKAWPMVRGAPYSTRRLAASVLPGENRRQDLALVLAWLHGSGHASNYCLAAGLPPSTMSVHLKKGRAALLVALKNIPEAAIRWPKEEAEIQKLQRLMLQKWKDPSLAHIYGFVDGTKLRIIAPSNPSLQRYYNKWKTDTYINCLYVFGTDGTILYAYVNVPGKHHDMYKAHELIKLTTATSQKFDGASIVGDTAFRPAGPEVGVLTGMKENEQEAIAKKSPEEAKLRAKAHNVITSLRQAAEWGINSVKSSWGRFSLPLPLDNRQRKEILLLCAHMHNLRTRMVGFNQIRTYFEDKWGGNSVAPRLTPAALQFYQVGGAKRKKKTKRSQPKRAKKSSE